MFKIFLYIAFFISAVITFYNFKSARVLLSKKNRLVKTQKELESLLENQENLKKELAYKKSDDFVIKEAREKLNYGFEGEKILIFPKEEYLEDTYDLKDNDTSFDYSRNSYFSEPNYLLWFRSFFY